MDKIGIVKLAVFIPLALAAAWMGHYLYSTIMEKDQEYTRIVQGDQLAIERLVKIREVMKLHYGVKGNYPESWDKFTQFVLEAQVPITEVKETVLRTSYGGDSISITIDTLDMVPAFDELKGKLKCSRDEVTDLRNVPLTKHEFELTTKEMRGAQVVQVSDPNPVNPRRHKELKGDLKPLKFGSNMTPTLKGNWEK